MLAMRWVCIVFPASLDCVGVCLSNQPHLLVFVQLHPRAKMAIVGVLNSQSASVRFCGIGNLSGPWRSRDMWHELRSP